MAGLVTVTASTRSYCFRAVTVVVIARVGHVVQCAEELLVGLIILVEMNLKGCHVLTDCSLSAEPGLGCR